MIALASASPVRARLLRAAGVAFQVVATRFDEATAKAELLAEGTVAAELAAQLALGKACAASAPGEALVIGADQVLELDGTVLSKAANLGQAREHLCRLRGREHRLHTAAALARNGEPLWTSQVSARLVMRGFTDDFLDRYLEEGGEALLGSVGCYHLEGAGAQLFEVIEGDYFAILGLPLIPLLAALRAHGELAP